VRLCIRLGQLVGLTIRQLGYPTKNALKHWHREYEQRRGIVAASEKPYQRMSSPACGSGRSLL